MSLERKDVENIAHLARLAINEADIPGYGQELSRILALVEQMSATDTSAVEPLAHPLEMSQRLRDDKVTESDQHEKFQKVAPQVEADLYLVPKVIE
jgi:aspartyl-tRNA(Asn)/glutamyl-tRNA(Gln) amidotransferase subunit C